MVTLESLQLMGNCKDRDFVFLFYFAWGFLISVLLSYITSSVSPPSSSPTLLPSPHSSRSTPSEKKKSPRSTKYSIPSCNKTKQGWTRPPSRRKKVPKAGKSQRQTPLPLVGSHKNVKLQDHNLYAEDLEQTYVGLLIVGSVSVSPYEPLLVDSVSRVFVIPSTPLAPTLFAPLPP